MAFLGQTDYTAWDMEAQSISSLQGAWRQTSVLLRNYEYFGYDNTDQFYYGACFTFGIDQYVVGNAISDLDRVGGLPNVSNHYGNNVSDAATRAAYYALAVLTTFPEATTFVEVGGGSGLFALALFKFAALLKREVRAFSSYELSGPQSLQASYAKDSPISYKDAGTFGADCDNADVLVSLNGISEFEKSVREQYLSNLLPKCNGYFFVWNSPEYSDALKDAHAFPEQPTTSIFSTVVTNSAKL